MAKVMIFAGGFGSGKTELAINFALARSRYADEVVLADLDLANPYYASAEMRDLLESAGIRLLSHAGLPSADDLPSIPEEIVEILRGSSEVLIDVAGDEMGALVLEYLSRYLKERECLFYLVLNPFCLSDQDFASMPELRYLLESAAGLNLTGLISNPNLRNETSPDMIRNGHRMVLDRAKSLRLPVAFITAENKFYNELVAEYGAKLQGITLYLKPEWLQ
ncbi:MAG TPA: hypothetical protein VN441_05100 [Syntrophomonas sp.]|nr:hypothetical protein [Syntrophomonas sp.]